MTEIDPNSADSWLNLKTLMEKTLSDLDLDWRYQPNLDVPKTQAEREWDGLWFRHRNAVDSWIERWISGQKIEEPDGEIKFLIACRFYSVSRIIETITFMKDGHIGTVFPFPNGSREAVLRGLLNDWSKGKGMLLVFDDGWTSKMAID